MHVSVLTLFPEVIAPYCSASIIGRAQKQGLIKVDTHNPRDFTTDAHHKVDDSPYGGGSGMVMMCDPIMQAYESLRPLPEETVLVMTTPSGIPFTQKMAETWSQQKRMVLFCGHYEGIDDRISQLVPNLQEVSIGDFVLTGGELAAMVMLDATCRLIPGVVGKPSSIQAESFSDGLLEHPHFTRPDEYRGLHVPEVLLSGNHGEIARWRREQSLALTLRRRPDLLKHAELSRADEAFLAQLTARSEA